MPKFRELKDTDSGLKSQLKLEIDKTYLLRFCEDNFEEWNEIWPSFQTVDGKMVRRFVSNEDGDNLEAIHTYKKEFGIPANVPKNDHGGWRIAHKYAAIILTGTEVVVKDATAPGGKKKKIQWDAASPKILVFGRDIFSQLKKINENSDLIDAAVAKGLDMNASNCTDVYTLRVTKTKKGSASYEIDYDVQAGRLVGRLKEGAVDYSAQSDELKNHITPSKGSDVDEFISRYGEGGSGSSASEPEAVVETAGTDVDLEVPTEVDDTPAPAPAQAARPAARRQAPAPAPAAVDNDIDDVPEPTPAPAPARRAPPKPAPAPVAAAEPADAEIDTSDIDSLLED